MIGYKKKMKGIDLNKLAVNDSECNWESCKII